MTPAMEWLSLVTVLVTWVLAWTIAAWVAERRKAVPVLGVPSPVILPPSRLYPELSDEVDRALIDAEAELRRATAMWGSFNSAHEGFAVLLEEIDELKAHVWTNQRKRDLDAMRTEAIQCAAMALRFVVDVCDEERGRK